MWELASWGDCPENQSNAEPSGQETKRSFFISWTVGSQGYLTPVWWETHWPLSGSLPSCWPAGWSCMGCKWRFWKRCNYSIDSSCAPETRTCLSKESVGRLISGVFSLTVAFSQLLLAPPSLFIPLKNGWDHRAYPRQHCYAVQPGCFSELQCLPSLHEALHSIPSHTHASRTLFKYISGMIACLKLRSTKETALQLRAFLRCALQKVPTSPHRKRLNCIDVE